MHPHAVPPIYRPRRLWTTAFYQVIDRHFETFAVVYDDASLPPTAVSRHYPVCAEIRYVTRLPTQQPGNPKVGVVGGLAVAVAAC